ncbi:hypothetical protein WR25_25818 [Diploscapter pachys]|uniref:Uncharacterized protein n=1 Tax=Diploscapter pachys TaxID=2018661 RepID=A0A2A2KD51_9BILA|nr:hypothetical protein WR25_25818 [Diploscapter pachys]
MASIVRTPCTVLCLFLSLCAAVSQAANPFASEREAELKASEALFNEYNQKCADIGYYQGGVTFGDSLFERPNLHIITGTQTPAIIRTICFLRNFYLIVEVDQFEPNLSRCLQLEMRQFRPFSTVAVLSQAEDVGIIEPEQYHYGLCESLQVYGPLPEYLFIRFPGAGDMNDDGTKGMPAMVTVYGRGGILSVDLNIQPIDKSKLNITPTFTAPGKEPNYSNLPSGPYKDWVNLFTQIIVPLSRWTRGYRVDLRDSFYHPSMTKNNKLSTEMMQWAMFNRQYVKKGAIPLVYIQAIFLLHLFVFATVLSLFLVAQTRGDISEIDQRIEFMVLEKEYGQSESTMTSAELTKGPGIKVVSTAAPDNVSLHSFYFSLN